MYTILRLEYKDNITYLMIITSNICNSYDFLTYDTRKSIFVDECFTYDSFITKHETKNRDIKEMISIIGNMIQEIRLKNLMYKGNIRISYNIFQKKVGASYSIIEYG